MRQPVPWSHFYSETMFSGKVLHVFSLSYKYRDINFGRAFRSGQKRLNNADEDAGVMKAGK
jgi:hypothetical protein